MATRINRCFNSPNAMVNQRFQKINPHVAIGNNNAGSNPAVAFNNTNNMVNMDSTGGYARVVPNSALNITSLNPATAFNNTNIAVGNRAAYSQVGPSTPYNSSNNPATAFNNTNNAVNDRVTFGSQTNQIVNPMSQYDSSPTGQNGPYGQNGNGQYIQTNDIYRNPLYSQYTGLYRNKHIDPSGFSNQQYYGYPPDLYSQMGYPNNIYSARPNNLYSAYPNNYYNENSHNYPYPYDYTSAPTALFTCGSQLNCDRYNRPIDCRRCVSANGGNNYCADQICG